MLRGIILSSSANTTTSRAFVVGLKQRTQPLRHLSSLHHVEFLRTTTSDRYRLQSPSTTRQLLVPPPCLGVNATRLKSILPLDATAAMRSSILSPPPQQRRRLLSTLSQPKVDEMDDDGTTTTEAGAGKQSSFTMTRRKGMRCLAIVAHVDHGKTSLVDRLLQAASGNEQTQNTTTERLLDSGDLEKERGITITSKVTRIEYVPSSSFSSSSSHKEPAQDRGQQPPIIINLADT